MIKQFSSGAGHLIGGFGLITRSGIRPFVVIPALVNFVLFAGLIYLGVQYFDGLMADLIPSWLEWLEWLIWPLFALMVLIISYYSFTLVANLLAAPFNDRLSERVASQLGAAPAREGRGLIGDIAESIVNEIRKWLYFAGLALVVLILWLIPVTTFLAPFLWIALGAWMMAVEYIGYPLANQGMSFREQRRWIHGRRAVALGFGLVALGATMIPIVNFLVMPAAVAGATRLWAEIEQPE